MAVVCGTMSIALPILHDSESGYDGNMSIDSSDMGSDSSSAWPRDLPYWLEMPGNEYACGGYVKICASGEDWDRLRLYLEWEFWLELNWCDAAQGWIVTMHPIAE